MIDETLGKILLAVFAALVLFAGVFYVIPTALNTHSDLGSLVAVVYVFVLIIFGYHIWRKFI